MNRILGNALFATLIAGLSLPAVAIETTAESLSKDPLVVAGCEERAQEEGVAAEGIKAFVQQCLEDMAADAPEGEDDKVAKKEAEAEKAKN